MEVGEVGRGGMGVGSLKYWLKKRGVGEGTKKVGVRDGASL